MFMLGGAVQDPNRRDSILREKRRRLERRLSIGLIAVAAVMLAGGVIALIHGLLTGNGDETRISVGFIGGGGFLVGMGYLGYHVSKGDLS